MSIYRAPALDGCLKVLVIGTRAAFRGDPVDDLVGVLDIAGLADRKSVV